MGLEEKRHFYGLLCLPLNCFSPEHNVIIKVAAGTNADDCALRCKTWLDEGPWVEHTQQGVDENLRQDENSSQYTDYHEALNTGEFLKYLFALWWGRVVTIVGQVPGEDIELARNHPPRVAHFPVVLWGQEGPKLAGRERGKRHCWALPWTQPTHWAVRHLQDQEAKENQFITSEFFKIKRTVSTKNICYNRINLKLLLLLLSLLSAISLSIKVLVAYIFLNELHRRRADVDREIVLQK